MSQSSRAGIPQASFVDTESLIHYKTFDERMIPAWYYRLAMQQPMLRFQ